MVLTHSLAIPSAKSGKRVYLRMRWRVRGCCTGGAQSCRHTAPFFLPDTASLRKIRSVGGSPLARVGVFICHCGRNIAGQIDVERLTRFAQSLPGVVFATHHIFMCSPTGFAVVKEACCRYGLDGFVVAACSPRLHLATFRRYAADCGLNPYPVSYTHLTLPTKA